MKVVIWIKFCCTMGAIFGILKKPQKAVRNMYSTGSDKMSHDNDILSKIPLGVGTNFEFMDMLRCIFGQQAEKMLKYPNHITLLLSVGKVC